MRKGFSKIHVGMDVESKQILAVTLTDEYSHDSKHLIVRESAKRGTVAKVCADDAFDSQQIFSHLDDRNIIAAIR